MGSNTISTVKEAIKLAKKMRHEYVTNEHMLYVMTFESNFQEAFYECGGDIEILRSSLNQFFVRHMEKIHYDGYPKLSKVAKDAVKIATEYAIQLESDDILSYHVLYGISQSEESYACYYIAIQNIDYERVIAYLRTVEVGGKLRDSGMEGADHTNLEHSVKIPGSGFGIVISQIPLDQLDQIEKEMLGIQSEFRDIKDKNSDTKDKNSNTKDNKNEAWKKLVLNLNEHVKTVKEPLVGREDIIERTIQILCRKYKSNAIHLGEPGVGKTAITLGIAKMLNEGNVPEQLKGATIYSLDMGSLIAGTHFRGEFENRLGAIINGLNREYKPIVYIDEIHTMVGAGAGSEGSLDASNILKRSLTEGNIRFIGATTYEEYKKYFEKDKALSRRFKTVDVRETNEEETLEILNGVKRYYEEYHNVTYTDEAITSAIKLSSMYITDRFLPDKAIDLLDEAGAAVGLTRTSSDVVPVYRCNIEEVLSKTCNIPKQTVESSEVNKLATLSNDMKAEVFGQDTAIEELVRCIKIARAGLNDHNKPIASMLFVGPTGTGKTEVAKTLAKNTGVKLIRFDMSEYQEKHAVAKFIGSPAGYVGYDDGGQLTEIIRKNPHCVLLLDEIEKAHPDVYNTLLQVMDNATLTDNQGRRADFRNVVIIMTSNAGARDIGKRGIGFGAVDAGNNVMDAELKRVFAPEFRNRLTKVIKFNPINDEMALMIAEKQFGKLKEKVEAKGVKLTVTKRCYKAIADKGTSIETGAREIQRIIDNEVKPLLVDEILFGDLKEGAKCRLDHLKDGFKIYIK